LFVNKNIGVLCATNSSSEPDTSSLSPSSSQCHLHHCIVMVLSLLSSAKINFSYSILFNLTTSYSSYFRGKKGISRNKTSFFLLMVTVSPLLLVMVSSLPSQCCLHHHIIAVLPLSSHHHGVALVVTSSVTISTKFPFPPSYGLPGIPKIPKNPEDYKQ